MPKHWDCVHLVPPRGVLRIVRPIQIKRCRRLPGMPQPLGTCAFGVSQGVQRIVRPIQIKRCQRLPGMPKPLEICVFGASQGVQRIVRPIQIKRRQRLPGTPKGSSGWHILFRPNDASASVWRARMLGNLGKRVHLVPASHQCPYL